MCTKAVQCHLIRRTVSAQSARARPRIRHQSQMRRWAHCSWPLRASLPLHHRRLPLHLLALVSLILDSKPIMPVGLISSILAFATLVASQSPVDPPWELQTFVYGWYPQNDTITQCRTLGINWATRKVAGAPAIVPPFTLIWYLGGYEPYRLQMGAGSPGPVDLTYNWLVNLPTGGPYLHSMIDGAGANGGVSVIALRKLVQLRTNPRALRCPTASQISSLRLTELVTYNL